MSVIFCRLLRVYEVIDYWRCFDILSELEEGRFFLCSQWVKIKMYILVHMPSVWSLRPVLCAVRHSFSCKYRIKKLSKWSPAEQMSCSWTCLNVYFHFCLSLLYWFISEYRVSYCRKNKSSKTSNNWHMYVLCCGLLLEMFSCVLEESFVWRGQIHKEMF